MDNILLKVGGYETKIEDFNVNWIGFRFSTDLNRSSNDKNEWLLLKNVFGLCGQGFFCKGKLQKVKRS